MADPLTQIRIFQSLSPQSLQKIKENAIIRQYRPGDMILMEGQRAEAVFFISEGEVRIYHLSIDGREQVLATLGSGSSFNTVSPLLKGEQHTPFARAMAETTLVILRNADYLARLRDCPDFCFTMLSEFAGRLSHLTGLVENLSLHSVRGRLARFLLDQAEGSQLRRRWTQDEIAEHLGSVRDVIGRTLRDFAEAGYIRRDGHRINLVDREALEREAQF